MNQEEFEKVKNDVRAYLKLKDEVKGKRLAIQQQVTNNQLSFWQAELLIDELYKDLMDTDERKKYIGLANKAKTGDVFEKYFRSANLEAMLGVYIDPKNL